VTEVIVEIAASGDDAMVNAADASYPPTTVDGTFTSEPTDVVVRRKDGATYRVRVGVMRFNTASIPDGATITSASLRLYPTFRVNTDTATFVAEWYAFDGSAAAGDYTGVPSDTAHAGTAIGGLTLNSDQDFALQTLSNINKTGYTGLRLHIDELGSLTGDNQLQWSSWDHSTNAGPRLVVTYEENPSYVNASTGTTDATGAWTHTSAAPAAAGNILIVQALQDGTAADVSITSVTNAEDLAGTDNTLTSIGEFAVGSGPNASQHLWIGRALSTSAMVITGANAGGDDVYVRVYEFANINTGTALTDVIENASAGATVNSSGTSATASDAGVTTLGSNRLALNFVAVNDDNAISEFTGESGGDWALAVSPYAASGGTDGAIALQIAEIAAAGTIDGGTGSIVDSDPWGAVGFALIGTAPAGPATPAILYDPRALQYLRVR
jgi:hypothetical protein